MPGIRNLTLVAFFLAAFSVTEVSAQRITAIWREQQLSTVLERIASTVSTPLWLDRRVNPRQVVNAQFTDVPFQEALAELAGEHDLGVAQIGDIMYVGPRSTARGLTTLSHQAHAALRTAPAAQRKKWLQAAPWSWPRLSEPRALLADLVLQANMELVGGELVPHDLWPARKLPPLALVDRVMLVLAGFDLTCEISPDGKTCRVVPIEYPLPDAGDDARPRLSDSSQRKSSADARRQFSLRLENRSVGQVLEQLAGQLQLEVSWNDASLRAKNLTRETLVSCDVVNADLDGLLRGILQPAGLAFTREGRHVEIHAER
jgi:hypothetical protein